MQRRWRIILGAVASPSHAGSIEAEADEVAHGALDRTGADVEVVATQRRVRHPLLVRREVLEDGEQSLATALVPGAGLRDRVVRRGHVFEHVGDLATSQLAQLLGDPLPKWRAALRMETTSSLPELFGDVVPVDARHSLREIDLLVSPDVIGAVGEKEAALATVTATLGVYGEPAKERLVAFEGRDEALVDGSLPSVARRPESVDHADESNFGVLALVTLLAARPRMFASTQTATVSFRSLRLPSPLTASRVLRRGDHRCAATVDLDHEDFSVVIGRSVRVEKAASFGADSVDHAQRRTRARCPLVKLSEQATRRPERHQRAELYDRRHRPEAEARAHAELAIDGKVSTTTTADRAPDGSYERDLAEPRADLAPTPRVRVERESPAVVLVGQGSRTGSVSHEKQGHNRTPEVKQRRPKLSLDRSKCRRVLRFRASTNALDRALDISSGALDSRRHGAPSGWCSCFATGYLPRMSPFFQPTRRNRSISLCFSSADRELHPTANDVSGRHLETLGADSYRCNFNFAYLDAYLDTHVDPYGSRTAYRSFEIQLAPIFFDHRVTPPYLSTVLFDEPTKTMSTKYNRMWDQILPQIAQHTNITGSANVAAIAIGNEVNAYLNLTGVTDTWAQYSQFLTDVIAHINSTNSYTTETVSTQCFGGCGLCDAVGGTCTAAMQTEAVSLMAQTDFMTLTYYPYPVINPNSTDLDTRIGSDLGGLAFIGQVLNRGVVLQEAGYPTAALPGGPTPAATQKAFVDSLFKNLATYSGNIYAAGYFSVYDYPPSNPFFLTGFFPDNSATPKTQSDWNNFRTKMAPNNCAISAGGVCCAMGCIDSSNNLLCGGPNCSDLPPSAPLGASQCCVGTIQGDHPPACNSAISNAPCALNCNTSVCCNTGCMNGGVMQCGGPQCSGFLSPNGADQCCTGNILSNGVHCDGDPSRAPCIYP